LAFNIYKNETLAQHPEYMAVMCRQYDIPHLDDGATLLVGDIHATARVVCPALGVEICWPEVGFRILSLCEYGLAF